MNNNITLSTNKKSTVKITSKSYANSIKNSNNSIIIVFGACKKIGRLISTMLLSKGLCVILIVKNKQKFLSLISEYLLNRIKCIVEIDFNEDFNTINNKFEYLNNKDNINFDGNKFNNINKVYLNAKNTYVIINAIDVYNDNDKDKDICMNNYFNTQSSLHNIIISKFIKNNIVIKRYIMLSHVNTIYPFAYSSFVINVFNKMMLNYIKTTEDNLKKLNLNYIIIRHPDIINLSKEFGLNNNLMEKIDVTQGKLKTKSKLISDISLTKLIVDSLYDSSIPEKCSFECCSYYNINNTKSYIQYLKSIIDIQSTGSSSCSTIDTKESRKVNTFKFIKYSNPFILAKLKQDIYVYNSIYYSANHKIGFIYNTLLLSFSCFALYYAVRYLKIY